MPGDPYWADVVFLSGFETDPPEDESSYDWTITELGSVAVTTAAEKFGAQSLDITGGSALSMPHSAAQNMGSDPFTMDGWLYLPTDMPTGSAAVIAAKYDSGSGTGASWWLRLRRVSGDYWLQFVYYDNANGTGFQSWLGNTEIALAATTQHHFAVDWDGTTLRSYFNGTMLDSATPPLNAAAGTAPLTIGAFVTSGATSSTNEALYIDDFRITIGTARYASNGGYTVPTTEAERGPVNDLDDEIVEGIGIEEAAGPGDFAFITEAVSMATTPVGSYTRTLTDGIGTLDYIYPQQVWAIEVGETAGVASGAEPLSGVVMREGMGLTEDFSPTGIYTMALSDGAVLWDTLQLALEAPTSETVGLAPTWLAVPAVTLAEVLGLESVFSPSAVYHLSIEETLRQSASLANFFGADITDSFGAAITIAATLKADGSVTEGMAIAAEVEPRMVLRVTAAEGVELAATEALQALYTADIEEDVEITVGYVAPGVDFTTWAMNVRTGAVTEYTNYAFRSFVEHQGNYFGAADDGLYRLDGDTDNSDDIIADIKSGILQLGGTRLSRLKAAYLAARGGGDFVLKVETTEPKTFVYSVTAQDMRTVKVNMGKGQRARYFSFELISAGQDFDLETLEFVPITVQRRV